MFFFEYVFSELEWLVFLVVLELGKSVLMILLIIDFFLLFRDLLVFFWYFM